MKAYIETSAVNRAEAYGLTGGVLNEFLSKNDYQPVIGMHTIYELAKGFLRESEGEKAARLFSMVRDLEPTYLPMTPMLLEQEVLKLRTGAEVLPFLDFFNHTSTTFHIQEMAQGRLSPNGRHFLEDRERRLTEESKAQSMDYLQYIRALKMGDGVPSLRTFEHVWQYFQSDIPRLIQDVLRGSVSNAEAEELHARLVEFPVLSSAVRANVYYSAIHLIHGAVPGRDKLNDPRHVIDASYCSALITSDDQLGKRAEFINSNLKIETLERFLPTGMQAVKE